VAVLDLTEVEYWLGRLGRPTPALDEILRALKENLWPLMDHLGFPARCQPKTWHYAGEAKIGELGWPCIVVGGAFNSTEFGLGQMDEDEINVTVAYAPAIERREFQESLDIACLTRGILYHPTYRAQHKDPDAPSRLLWVEIHPLGLRMVPPEFKNYSGWMARYLLRQPPGSNLWGSHV